MTASELRALLDARPDDETVYIHFGWDLDIVETDYDDAGFILFADPDAGVSTVSTAWLKEKLQ